MSLRGWQGPGAEVGGRDGPWTLSVLLVTGTPVLVLSPVRGQPDSGPRVCWWEGASERRRTAVFCLCFSVAVSLGPDVLLRGSLIPS